ncbi:hypothetical protein APR08_006369 [Nocardia amikacinitolerans]|nr:hypothetical protein [Nocardia amikacinitolerans]
MSRRSSRRSDALSSRVANTVLIQQISDESLKGWLRPGDAAALCALLQPDMLAAIEELAESPKMAHLCLEDRYTRSAVELVRVRAETLADLDPESAAAARELHYGVIRLARNLVYYPEFRRQILEYTRGDVLAGDRFCAKCRSKLPQGGRGRPRKYCNEKCRKQVPGRRLRKDDA